MSLSWEVINKYDTSSLGALLRQIRQQRGWNQTEAALQVERAFEALGIGTGQWSQSQYSRWERNVADHKIESLRAISHAFHIHPEIIGVAIDLIRKEELPGSIPAHAGWDTPIPHDILGALNLPPNLKLDKAIYLSRQLRLLRDWLKDTDVKRVEAPRAVCASD
jgi:transcriptional regulator with XRE-family HTH domain